MSENFIDAEERLVSAGHGKWSIQGVPHKGWSCVDIQDLGEPLQTCQMCEKTAIRYVHYMRNSAYDEVLEVGCVCAGHMEGNLHAARTRESGMKSRASKRARWLTRRWRRSKKGNPWIKADGYRVTIYPKGSGWGATVSKDIPNAIPIHSRLTYRTEAEVKLAAFDHITRLESNC